MVDALTPSLSTAPTEETYCSTAASEANRLLPVVLVAAYGRSGTTGLMALLGTNSRILMGRAYPFEHRYLTYLAKLHLALDRQVRSRRLSGERVCEFEDDGIGGDCWAIPGPKVFDERLPQFQNPGDKLVSEWRSAGDRIRADSIPAAYYAEKVPAWMPALLQQRMPTKTLYLFRDPRDVFLSANAFMSKLNYFSFGRGPADDDLSHARNLAYEYWYYYENYLRDRNRADVLPVEYAEMIENTADLANRLSTFLGLDLLPQPLNFDGHRTSTSPRDSVNRWRREKWDPEVLGMLEHLLREPMQELGYKPSTDSIPSETLPLVDFTRDLDLYLQLTNSPDGTFIPSAEDGLRCHITGEDFYLLLPVDPFEAAPVREIWVSIACDVDQICSLYWHGPQCEFSEETAIHIACHGGAHRRIVRFAVANHPQWCGRIERLRLDLFNCPHSLKMTQSYVRWVRFVA